MVGETAPIEDARVITDLVMAYFAKIHQSLPFLHFKVETINKNSDPSVWIVRCSFDKAFGSQERTTYTLKVNSKTSGFSDIQEVKEPKQ